ncbi:zinc finger protein 26-like [Sabethes cyaneus]|uniref:zinc finger protein 26-like n=1 Tax=Sabethes cyaneus TaxID=53552 RepID=UPI00237DEE7C|nr:zinc finger protein 26-like [Sabethes cyaneus]
MNRICALCSKNEITLDIVKKSAESLETTFECMISIFNFQTEQKLPKCCCQQCFKDLRTAYFFYCRIMQSLKNMTMPSTFSEITTKDQDYQYKIYNSSHQADIAPLQHNNHTSDPQNIHCRFCNKKFKTVRGLEQHMFYCNHTDSNKCLRCHLCRQDFKSKANYKNHMRHHQDFICRLCNRGWITDAHLLEHVKNAHTDQLFQCVKCTKTEKMRKTLNRHLGLAHGVSASEVYCGHCSTELPFDNIIALNKHIHHEHKHLEQPSLMCNELLSVSLFPKELESGLEIDNEYAKPRQVENQEIFLRNFNLLRTNLEDKHEIRTNALNHNKMILEEFLDEAFENDQIWTKYIEGGEEYLIDNYDFYLEGNTTRILKKYKCPMCDDGFDKQHNLTAHLAKIHDIACLICNDCGASFNKISEYKNHRQDHLKENARFRENIIPEAEEALSLVKHEEKTYEIQETTNSYSFRCRLCDRRFIKKCNLEKHHCSYNNTNFPNCNETYKPSHSEEDADIPESLFCTLCDKKFKSISGLKYHLKRHTDIKAFSCLYCNKKFTANSNLNAHIRNVHSEQKNHVCKDCNMRFAGKDHLTKHIRFIHRLERNFQCSECPKKYFQKSHLNDHVAATHMGFKAFSCEICTTFYSCRGSLRRHMIKSHKVV